MNVRESWRNLEEELHRVRERGSKDPNSFLEIRGIIDKVPGLILYDDSLEKEVGLVHYTTWKSALNMFDLDKKIPVIRMYNYEQSNDPEEGRIIPPEWKDLEREARESWLDEFLKNDDRWGEEMKAGSTYGCSFSSGPSDGVEDDLTYWRLYGNGGHGCSLKISTLHGIGVYKVRYRDRSFENRCESDKKEDGDVAKRLKMLFEARKQTVDNASSSKYKYIVGRTVAEVLLRILYGYYHLIKNISYADEKEWRIIKVMPKPDQIRYDTMSMNLVKRYIEGPKLKDILVTNSTLTIGPTVPNQGVARDYFEYVTKEIHEIKSVKVNNSKQTYRQG